MSFIEPPTSFQPVQDRPTQSVIEDIKKRNFTLKQFLFDILFKTGTEKRHMVGPLVDLATVSFDFMKN